VALNHHVTLLHAGHSHKYRPGRYSVHIVATVLGDNTSNELANCSVLLDEATAKLLTDQDGWVLFNWNPNTSEYAPDVKLRPQPGIL